MAAWVVLTVAGALARPVSGFPGDGAGQSDIRGAVDVVARRVDQAVLAQRVLVAALALDVVSEMDTVPATHLEPLAQGTAEV